jgi:hypothetical protein
MNSLSRRCFVQGVGIAGLGLLAGCGRWPGQAAPPAKVPRVGYLGFQAVGATGQPETFRDALWEFGYIEGQLWARLIGCGNEPAVGPSSQQCSATTESYALWGC